MDTVTIVAARDPLWVHIASALLLAGLLAAVSVIAVARLRAHRARGALDSRV